MPKFCSDNRHGKSIVKRWYDTDADKFFAIMRCRKCDIWARIQIVNVRNENITPVIEREYLKEMKGKRIRQVNGNGKIEKINLPSMSDRTSNSSPQSDDKPSQ